MLDPLAAWGSVWFPSRSSRYARVRTSRWAAANTLQVVSGHRAVLQGVADRFGQKAAADRIGIVRRTPAESGSGCTDEMGTKLTMFTTLPKLASSVDGRAVAAILRSKSAVGFAADGNTRATQQPTELGHPPASFPQRARFETTLRVEVAATDPSVIGTESSAL